ncbi:uncharacterized protein SOCG_00982 [Schizosaccharomyces octosporus yFS286]|uniref:Uncharacterized protein n=1 Tax=Schizosaccharomyces octosporus (strain yFS286) TaxID=483514 RepID=S9PZ22_SCHOY|nr:uncharacterized protein SOCG_00982 [Schizosaccharomyces octosporus yFS286]EPX73227.1 hypothetical protein SOCG_00982 [Schizosaccharomyces octosporus yFS286]
MDQKEKERHQKTVEPVKDACLSCSTNSESDLPKYSEIPYSHVDNMEKGCLCLQSDPDPAPSYSRRRHQEASIHMAQGNGFFILLRDVLSALLWLIFWPAKIVRIPEAQRRQENETARLSFCFIISVMVDFWFSYKYLVPFIRESMKESVRLWFQITVAAVLVIVAFYMFLYVCSLLVDFIVILIPLVLTEIISALGFRMLSERNDLTDDNCIPLNGISTETENQFNDCNDNSLEQPSSEHSEQSPGLRREPGQSRDVENSES